MFSNFTKAMNVKTLTSGVSLTIALLICWSLLTSNRLLQQSDDWTVPSWADTLSNPVANNVDAIEKGKKTYNKMCWTCHGKSGKGDGPAAANLDPKPKDHTSKEVQQESDGALFWKITTGKGVMAPYEKVLSEEERWQLVNYIKTLDN